MIRAVGNAKSGTGVERSGEVEADIVRLADASAGEEVEAQNADGDFRSEKRRPLVVAKLERRLHGEQSLGRMGEKRDSISRVMVLGSVWGEKKKKS